MKDQHTKISGFRDLTQGEIDLMNEIKAFGPQFEALCSKIEKHLDEQMYDVANDSRLGAADPMRWLEIGKTNLQQGLMAVTRAVAQPTFF